MNDSVVVDLGLELMAPLGDRVLVLPDQDDGKVAGGLLYKPDTARTRSQRGTIVAVGPDVKGVQVGQRVLCTFWSAVHLDINNQEHFLYGEKDILGILTGEDLGGPR